MTVREVRAVVLDVLREVQSLRGREWSGLGVGSTPIGSLDGFDSLCAIEATVMLEEKLGCTLKVESVFVSEDSKRALTLKEISRHLSKVLSRNGGTT